MNPEHRRASVEVGSIHQPVPSTLADGSKLDSETIERCREVVAWNLDPLLDTAASVKPELGSLMLRLAAEKLVEHMNPADAESLMKQLARKIVEHRRTGA